MDIEQIKSKGIVIGIALGIIVILLLALNPFISVGAGERGVLMNFGEVQDKVLEEGLNFIIPIMQSVEIVDVKVQKSETSADASSKDLQTVSSSVALNYYIIPEKAHKVYQSIGKKTAVDRRIIDPAVQEVVKAVSANYTAEQLITLRRKVSTEMKESLTKRLLKYNIAVDAFSIVNFSFSKAYQNEIEAKQVAEQRVKKAKLELKRIEVEKKQKITQAQAEAEALRLQKMNITPDLIKLRQIEATILAINKWDGKMPRVTGGALPFVDVKSYAK